MDTRIDSCFIVQCIAKLTEELGTLVLLTGLVNGKVNQKLRMVARRQNVHMYVSMC